MKPFHPPFDIDTNIDIDIPVAAFRLQLRPEFSLKAARSLIPYLEELGITHIYASPLFAARRGSTHGYDVVDPTTINPELGGREAFEELTDELARRGMGLLLDIVPNHMAATTENPWWRDVLERGPHSPYAPIFDIDWTPTDGRIRNRILLPVLGAPYEQVLKNNELKLTLDEDGFALRYYEHRFPLARHTYADILNYAPLTDRNALDDIKNYLTHRKVLDKILEEINQSVSGSNGKTLFEQILEKQFYRLCYWRKGIEQVNYRRFFDISDLAGVRLEAPQVFEATHSFLFSLAEKNQIAGVRVDHIDGLRDPEGYLRRLARQLGRHRAQRRPYIVVEKILAGDETDETLPEEWPVHGTTGYDFLNLVNRLFVNPAGARTLARTYSNFVGEKQKKQSIEDLVYSKKTSVLQTLFASEVDRLTNQLADLLGELRDRKRKAK